MSHYRQGPPQPDPDEAPAPPRHESRPRRQTTSGLYYLPGETRSELLADFVTWYNGLAEGGGTGAGANYAGVRVSDIRHTAEIVMRRLMHLRFGAGDDVLFVAGEQADRCRACIGSSRETTDSGAPATELCRKGR